MGFLILLIVVIVLIVIVKKGKRGGGVSMPAPPGFSATFQFKDVIAIDVNQNVLMVKDALSNRVVYTKKADILRWNNMTGGNGHFLLQIHVRDLQSPVIHVNFGRNRANSGDIRNEWESRLTTWVNNS